MIFWVFGNTFSCFLGLKIFLWVICIPNPMQTFYIFLGPIYKLFCGSFAFQNPCTDWSRLVFRQYLATSVAWQHFCFLDSYINIFVGSLHSILLHGVELLSFFGQYLATIVIMATLFLFLLPIYKHFCGFFFAFQAPAQIGAD